MLNIDDDVNIKISRDQSGSSGRNTKYQKILTPSFKNQHCSGVKTFSICNCGMSRRIRKDPFTLKVYLKFIKIMNLLFKFLI